jgi:hypothetical protein
MHHVRKRKIIRDLRLNLGNEGFKHHMQSTGGLRTPSTSNIFTILQSSILFLSNNVYSKVLTPKFGKESDLWVRLGEESV